MDVMTKLEPDFLRAVTGPSVEDFHLLVSLGGFNATRMNRPTFALRRYEDTSLAYTGIYSNPVLCRYGFYETVMAKDAEADTQ